jgi:hypothetical protein
MHEVYGAFSFSDLYLMYIYMANTRDTSFIHLFFLIYLLLQLLLQFCIQVKLRIESLTATCCIDKYQTGDQVVSIG